MGKVKELQTYGTVTKKPRNNDTPGQLTFNLDGSIREYKPEPKEPEKKENPHPVKKEEKPVRTEIDAEKIAVIKDYYEAFKRFLHASGRLNQTYYLYKNIIESPNERELELAISYAQYPDERERNEEMLGRLRNRISIMKNKHNCEDLNALLSKSKKEWKILSGKLWDLFRYAERAGVPMREEDKTSKRCRDIMLSYVILDNDVHGDCRRQYYREKIIQKYLKSIEHGKFNDVKAVSWYDMEEEYKSNELKEIAKKQARKEKKKPQAKSQ